MAALDEHYTNPRLAAIHDTWKGWSTDRTFYRDLAGNDPLRILDLGCGTGLLCNAYAEIDHRVTGVDPAESMLAIARTTANADRVEWVLSDAQTFESRHRYDLIIMTGHAFQVFLQSDDVASTFRVMRSHLARDGRIVFETRNPNIDWASRWHQTVELDLPTGRVLVERSVVQCTDRRIHVETRYEFADETLTSRSDLRFWTREELGDLLRVNGLRPLDVYGDWDRSPFRENTSEEMIFLVMTAWEPVEIPGGRRLFTPACLPTGSCRQIQGARRTLSEATVRWPKRRERTEIPRRRRTNFADDRRSTVCPGIVECRPDGTMPAAVTSERRWNEPHVESPEWIIRDFDSLFSRPLPLWPRSCS